MLVYNGKIITMAGETFENGFVRMDGDKITLVGQDDNLLISDADAVDLEGGVVLPGFVDGHSHMGMWEDALGFEGADGNEDTDPITPHLRGIDGVNPLDRCFEEAMCAGITTVITGPGSSNPIGGQLLAMKTYGGCVDARAVKAPVAMKFALGENPKNAFHEKDQTPITRMATAAVIREALFKARRYMQDKQHAATDEDGTPPDFDMKLEALIPVLQRTLPVHFHCHRADDIYTAVRIAKEFSLRACLIHCTEGYMIRDTLSQLHMDVICGPVIGDRSKPELKNATPKNPGLLAASGCRVALCTDHPELPIQYLPLSAAVCIGEGMPEYEALKAITITPAEICGIADRVGSIRSGNDADLVIYDKDFRLGMDKPKMVVAGGKVVFKREKK